MSFEPISCRYVFTMQEYSRSLTGYWRRTKWAYLAVIVCMFGLPTYNLFFPDPPTPNVPAQPLFWALVYDYLPSIFFVVFMGIFLRWQLRRGFKKGPFFEREFNYTLRDYSLMVVTPLMQAEYSWQAFALTGETPHGFYLFLLGNRSYQWLPKSGFASPHEIDRCRELLRENKKTAKLAPPAKSSPSA